MLLERGHLLEELTACRTAAAGGDGCAVFIAGEAGVGKTALVEEFLRTLDRETASPRVLWGACDALYTPRPLGPLRDMTWRGGGLRFSGERGDRERLFSDLLRALSGPPVGALAVFEDVHWADEATLDLLKFVGRRIRHTPGMILCTFRDDEVGHAHPLRRVLGELPSDAVRRLRVPPLSAEGVERLARDAGHDSADLHAITGGNPFFVTEVLAASDEGLPASVRDAVLARAARLSERARGVLDVVSIVPGRIERGLLEGLCLERGESPDATDALVREGLSSGMLRATSDGVSFRHELARRIWEDELEPGRAASLHAAVLRELSGAEDERALLPRLVHHATGCGDAETVLRLAPEAARDASSLGAHRQAAAHYERALRHARQATDADRAALLDGWSYELHLGGRISDAVRARRGALALWRSVGDRRREGDALRWLSRLVWFEGRRDDALNYADDAIRVLEPLGPGHELAMAYSTRAMLCILGDNYRGAADWGDRAVALAEELDDPEALVHALTNAACLDPGGRRANQVRAIRLAEEHGFHEHALRAYTWLICDCILERSYEPATAYLAEALAYARERDIDTFENYLTGWRARLRIETGRLHDAERDARTVLARVDAGDGAGAASVLRLPSLAALGHILARRGDPGAARLLDEALERALATEELDRLVPVAEARAEAAWLAGDHDTARQEAKGAYQGALEAGRLWDVGRLASWLRRAGAEPEVPDGLPPPHAAEFAGDWRRAAALWHEIGCPHERALALAEGDEAMQREALRLLTELGARPAASNVRRRLRRGGARGVPRGPHRSSRENPAGLTNRQMEVLRLLPHGMSNAAIAERLFISKRTVDHHVSAILRKLDTDSRTGAALIARELGLVQDHDPQT